MSGWLSKAAKAFGPADEVPPAFEPYGISGEIPDPIARALNALLDEVATLRARASELERAHGPAHDLAPADGSAASPDPSGHSRSDQVCSRIRHLGRQDPLRPNRGQHQRKPERHRQYGAR